MSFIHLEHAAQYITEERNYKRAMEELRKLFAEFPACAEEVLCEDRGCYGIDRANLEFLREKFRIWKAQQIGEKQSEAGRRTKNLRRGKIKAQAASPTDDNKKS